MLSIFSCALGRPRGIGWRGRWEGGLGWGIHENPWLIHINVWQKPLQYCKVISLQLIKKKKIEKKKVQIRLGLHFVPSLAGAAQAARSLTSALSPGAVHLLPSTVPASVSVRTSRVRAACVCSWELASSCDPPGGCRPSRISGNLWLENGGLLQFGRGCHLCGRVCPFPLPPASCLRWGWAGPPPASSSLVLLSPFVLQTAGRLIFSLSRYPTV